MERALGQGHGEMESLESYGHANALQADCTCEETIFYPLSPVFLTLYNSLLQEAG